MTRHRATHRTWVTSQVVWIALAIFAVLGASQARAQTAQETALARTLFEEGVQFADKGDWQGAADRFERAYAIKPTPGIAYNWASALAETQRLVQASELLQGILRDPTATPELRQECEAKLAAINPRMAYLNVHLAGDPGPDARVEVDGSDWPRAAWGVASPIDPGAHRVVCLQGGQEIARAELTLAEGERREVALGLPKPEVVPPPVVQNPEAKSREPKPEPDEGRPVYKSWVLWTAVGAVVAGGVVAALLVSSKGESKSEAPVMGNTSPKVISW